MSQLTGLPDRLRCVVDAVGLSSADTSTIQSLIAAQEWSVALEVLCTQVYEWDIPLTMEMVEELEEIGKTLNASISLTEFLRENLRDV